MLKSKIFFTVFVVYEIIAIILLHDTYTCNGMFSNAFCYDSGFKYFLFCVALPLMGLVAWLWIDQLFVARRRRHSWLHRAGSVVSDVASDIKTQIGGSFDMQDIDKYLAAAILFGVKKYSDTHPSVRNAVHEIINNANNRKQYNADIDYDDDADDTDYDDDVSVRSSRSRTTSRTGSGRRTNSGNATARRSGNSSTNRGNSRR